MALNSPHGLGTLSGMRDRIARLAGFDAFGFIQDQQHEARIDDSIDEALDRVAEDMGGSKTFEDEKSFNTAGEISGADGAITAGGTTFTSATSTFVTDGVAKGDKINYPGYDGMVRVLSVTNETTLELEIANPGDAVTAGAFSIIRDEYELQDDVIWVKRIWDATNARTLQLISQEQLAETTGENFDTTLKTSSEPVLAMIVHPTTTTPASTVGTRVRLYPAPDSGFTISYTYCKIPTFPGDELITGNHMGNLLYLAAASAYLLEDDDAARASLYEAKYLRKLPKAKKRDTGRARERIIMRQQFTPGAGNLDPQRLIRDPRIIEGN